MSLYRSMGRGSWIVERVLLGVPVRRATGLTDHRDAKDVEVALLLLAKHGRRDLIQAFAAGHLAGAELVAGVECYGASLALTAERAIALRHAVERWLETAPLAPTTKRNYRNGLAALARFSRHATVADLPALLIRYARRAKPVMFRRVRAAAQSFLSDTVRHGRHSELWRDVAGISGPRARRRQVQGGLEPEQARAVAEQLGRLGPMWWTLCTTGMGRTEYWRTRWEVLPDRVAIHGRKREQRDRIVPRLATPVRALVGDKPFAQALARAGRALGLSKLTIYVARRTYAHLLERAGILPSRCDAYMGHAPAGVPDLYREHNVVPRLAEDARALRATLGAEPQYMRALA